MVLSYTKKQGVSVIAITGLTGFDSKDNGYVSMQAHASGSLDNGRKQ